ncbi:MAG: class I SAM-dependent methyltransferase [Minisyncoccia bacterium]|jgi:ubiquinone/menaquinone biosynthesis C-methylase UbiE
MKLKDIKYLSFNQYASADKFRARWDLYEFAVPKIDIHQVGIEHLGLKRDENILEVGCGDGSVLVNLRQAGHFGKLVGLEINENIFQESLGRQIEFIVGSADDLPFPDKSFDVILAFFMLYHMPDIQKTLKEWKRALKDNGKVLIATGSQLNKPKNKAFKKTVENLIGKTASPQFSSSFNLENAEEQLKDTFKIIDRFVYEGQIQLEKPEPYLHAFNSVRDMYEPVPSDADWKKIESMVRAEIEKEIAQNGFFVDNVRRGFLVCENCNRG